jgi:hypothetical protein
MHSPDDVTRTIGLKCTCLRAAPGPVPYADRVPGSPVCGPDSGLLSGHEAAAVNRRGWDRVRFGLKDASTPSIGSCARDAQSLRRRAGLRSAVPPKTRRNSSTGDRRARHINCSSRKRGASKAGEGGTLLGTAVGDAIGLPFEGLSRRRVQRLLREPLGHQLFFGRGMVSDDTEHYLHGGSGWPIQGTCGPR